LRRAVKFVSLIAFLAKTGGVWDWME